MIKQIVIRNEATFDAQGCTLDNLKPINIIYGSNGTGKTTISRLLSDPQYHTTSELKWEDNVVLPTLTYNRDFCEQNLGELNNLLGVYTLGEDNVDKQRELAQKTEELNNKEKEASHFRDKIRSCEGSLKEATDNFERYCWTQIILNEEYKNNLLSLFQGLRGSKAKLANHICSWTNIESTLSSIDEIKRRYVDLYEEDLTEVQQIIIPSSDVIIAIEQNAVWDEIIVGSKDVPLAKLVEKLNISDWVAQGKGIIDNNNLEICPFCQQPFNDDLLSQLNNIFDNHYTERLQYVKALELKYRSSAESIYQQFSRVLSETRYSRFIDSQLFQNTLFELRNILDKNYAIIQNKIITPSEIASIWLSKDCLNKLTAILNEANAEIQKFNEMAANHKQEQKHLYNIFWSYIVTVHAKEIQNYIKKKNGLNSSLVQNSEKLQQIRTEISSLKKDIENLKASMSNIQATVAQINRTLSAYGITNFKLEQKDDYSYTLIRSSGEEVNNTLSEGERTFIMFLYFLQLIKGSTDSSKTNEAKIVVIDDPVSSLDSNILYVVSTLIKEHLKEIIVGDSNVKQIFILTHNIFFHHEVTYNYEKSRDKYSFWIINRHLGTSRIRSYQQNNPIQSSYSMLWHELRVAYENGYNVSIQNIMRRIYEYYFRFLGTFKDEEIINSFSDLEDKNICRSLISWINDGSHVVPDDYFIIMNDITVQQYLKVFKAIFDKNGHTAHYEMIWNSSLKGTKYIEL